MSRQIGAVLGIAVFVAVLGTPSSGEVLAAFTAAWVVLAGIGVLAGVVAIGMTPRTHRLAPVVAAGDAVAVSEPGAAR